jgi:hypothetical protein
LAHACLSPLRGRFAVNTQRTIGSASSVGSNVLRGSDILTSPRIDQGLAPASA